MGQCQSTNALSPFTMREENDRIKCAGSSMQGLRPYMEDARAVILDLDGITSTSFFGVYDGHGGANVASYCANRFHTELTKDEDYQNNLSEALKHVFPRMDEQMQGYDEWRALANPPRGGLCLLCCLRTAPCVQGTPRMEGSTACVALIRGHQIIVGNVGDSRCVLSRNGQAMNLSTDHKPDLPGERQRIEAAGGKITTDVLPVRLQGGGVGIQLGSSRVNGDLAMSRSIGDFRLKAKEDCPPEEQIVTCIPDILIEHITHDTEFLLIASDGIWDMMSSQSAVDFVHEQLQRGVTDLRTICEKLLFHCIRSRDNMTVILVHFKPIARLPPPPPPPPANVVSQANISSSSNTGAGAEAKAGTGGAPQAEIKEEKPLLSSSLT